MRICAASDIPLDSCRAHAINVIKTSGGFQRLGHEVSLLCEAPEQAEDGLGPLLDLGEPGLRVVHPPSGLGRGEDRQRAFGRWVAERAIRADVVYARHFGAAIECARAGRPTILETHAHIGDPNPLIDEALALTHLGSLSVTTISERLRAHYVRRGGEADRIRVVPDGVCLDLFLRPESIGPSPYLGPGPHAVYAGHLYDAKGIPAILLSAELLPTVEFHLLGGTEEDVRRVRSLAFERALENVTVHGRVAHGAVPPYLWHSDVLMLPPSARDPSRDWTSPVKLGEYLASGSPVVCSDIPALRDWIEDRLVVWFRPDDPGDLARAVIGALARVADGRDPRAARIARARELSYPRRAQRILDAASGAGSRAASA
ncbi:MAG: glycosyltransferase [Phycisphaeraceae bacterium]|nr:glycosyltransferase [Phycisphaeraceae bacterium]